MLPYSRGIRTFRLDVAWYLHPLPTWVKNFLNNYFAMYKHLTRSLKRMDFASPTYWG